jgi:hypothetical protein
VPRAGTDQPRRAEGNLAVEVLLPSVGSESRAPIKMVDRHPWSPEAYLVAESIE